MSKQQLQEFLDVIEQYKDKIQEMNDDRLNILEKLNVTDKMEEVETKINNIKKILSSDHFNAIQCRGIVRNKMFELQSDLVELKSRTSEAIQEFGTLSVADIDNLREE